MRSDCFYSGLLVAQFDEDLDAALRTREQDLLLRELLVSTSPVPDQSSPLPVISLPPSGYSSPPEFLDFVTAPPPLASFDHLKRIQLTSFTHRDMQFYALHVNDKVILRRQSDSYVNLTKLLKHVCKLPSRKVRRICESQTERRPIPGGHQWISGSWVPLQVARRFAMHYGKQHLVWPLLHDLPSMHLGVEFVIDCY